MTRLTAFLVALVVGLTSTAQAQQPAGPTTAPSAPKTSAEQFAARVDLKPLQTLTIQHRQTLKTLDSFARQTLSDISGKTSLDGRPALFTVLDMAFRPEDYVQRNVVKIKHAPLRMDLAELPSLSALERERIKKEGRISLGVWRDPEVRAQMAQIQSSAFQKAQAIGDVENAASTLGALGMVSAPLLRIIPPAKGGPDDQKWHNFDEIVGSIPNYVREIEANGGQKPQAIAAYADRAELLERVGTALLRLRDAWRGYDAEAANQQIAVLADTLPLLNPVVYPSALKRRAEVVYNRLAKLTVPGAAIYFVAFVLFLMASRSGIASLRIWGLRMLLLGLIVHTAGIAVRWWLVEKSTGDWFHSIPIKNQFESVLFSAWFGALVGLILELRRGRGMFGAAASFVGWLSLIAIFATPYVFGREIGGEIGQATGVLMSYWLYIHVTLVTASYALIGMGFLLSIWWLIYYYTRHDTVSRLRNQRQLSADAVRDDEAYSVTSSGGAVALGALPTLARILFVPVGRPAEAARSRTADAVKPDENAATFLATLDQCNLVVLQLAFWVLGVGIIFGAVWADMSWGRPWGWDPKETFALVTWIVYLVVVHVRVVTAHKAWWTALLSVIGFFIMLFNWIGVNFFLVGLHSYA